MNTASTGQTSCILCITSHHTTLAALLDDAEFAWLARQDNYLIEIRFDQYDDCAAENLLHGLDCLLQQFTAQHCVITCRHPQEGGKHAIADTARLALLIAAKKAGVAFIDVEIGLLPLFQNAAHDIASISKIIASIHLLHTHPSLAQLHMLRTQAEAHGADIVKIAVQTTDAIHGLPLLQLMQEDKPWQKPLLGVAMGEAGVWSRLLWLCFPHRAPFMFACSMTASTQHLVSYGQINYRDMRKLYHIDHINNNIAVYGIVGNPIAHSLSVILHNCMMHARHLHAVYIPFLITHDALGFMQHMAPLLGIKGLSVTAPYKEVLVAVCQTLQPLAAQIGAVNTIVQSSQTGFWAGYNTDAPAAVDCLSALLATSLQARTILILGAGGVAKAIAHACAAAGANVLIYNRTTEKADALAQQCGGRVVAMQDFAAYDIDVIIQATSHTEQLILHHHKQLYVLDVHYHPVNTTFLRTARAHGHICCNGYDLLLRQAKKQYDLFY